MKRVRILASAVLLGAALHSSVALSATNLPARYFDLLTTGVARIENRLTAEPAADLQTLETELTHAVGTVSFALNGKQTITFAVEASE